MKLHEEIRLRRLIRDFLISETREKVNGGWEDYKQGHDVDNSSISTGYDAAYHQMTADREHLTDIQKGGANVLLRRKQRRPRSK